MSRTYKRMTKAEKAYKSSDRYDGYGTIAFTDEVKKIIQKDVNRHNRRVMNRETQRQSFSGRD